MRREKDCLSGDLEREFNSNAFFIPGCLMLECDCFITCSNAESVLSISGIERFAQKTFY